MEVSSERILLRNNSINYSSKAIVALSCFIGSEVERGAVAAGISPMKNESGDRWTRLEGPSISLKNNYLEQWIL